MKRFAGYFSLLFNVPFFCFFFCSIAIWVVALLLSVSLSLFNSIYSSFFTLLFLFLPHSLALPVSFFIRPFHFPSCLCFLSASILTGFIFRATQKPQTETYAQNTKDFLFCHWSQIAFESFGRLPPNGTVDCGNHISGKNWNQENSEKERGRRSRVEKKSSSFHLHLLLTSTADYLKLHEERKGKKRNFDSSRKIRQSEKQKRKAIFSFSFFPRHSIRHFLLTVIFFFFFFSSFTLQDHRK